MINKDELATRFKMEIYFPSRLPILKHFFYAYGRTLKNLARTIIWLFCSKKPMKKNRPLGIFATENQKLALERLDCDVIHIGSVSFIASVIFIIANLLRFIMFPIIYFWGDRLSSFELSFVRLDFLAVNIILHKIGKNGIFSVMLSNDHAGPIYYLSIILRNSVIKCSFVQHGDLKPAFPYNSFDELWLRDTASLAIARKLCLNSSANFYLIPDIPPEVDVYVDVLVLLSHPFRIVELIKLKKRISERYPKFKSIIIRFHPSSRFKAMKHKIVTFIGYEVSICKDLRADILRSKICIGAMSSALREAVELKNNTEVKWCKEIGLDWDYYDLSKQIEKI